jgi:hypothetical protein
MEHLMLPVNSIKSPPCCTQASSIAPPKPAPVNPMWRRRPTVSSSAGSSTRVRWEPVEIRKESMSFRAISVMRPIQLITKPTLKLASTSVAKMLAKFEEVQQRLTCYAEMDLSPDLLREIQHRKILIAGQIAALKFDHRMRFCEPTPEYVDVGNKATSLLNRLQRMVPLPQSPGEK